MRRVVGVVCMCIGLLLCGCNSIVPLRLNTMRPAAVSYHKSSPHLVVVCNSNKPEVKEYSRYIDESGQIYRMNYMCDSVVSQLSMAMATLLYESNYFDGVELLYPDSSNITGDTGVSYSQKWQWEVETPNAVHLAINKIKPQAVMKIEPLDGIFGVLLSVASVVEMQCIIPGGTIKDVVVADTMEWYGYGASPSLARLDLPDMELCLSEAMYVLSRKAINYFVPHELVVERYIFNTGHPAMSDAYRYWENEQYDEASYVWEYVYDEAQNKGRKAKAAANLALYYELKDNYNKALTYATESHKIFVDAGYVEEVEYMAHYCNDLRTRIADSKQLEEQWKK